MPVQFTVLASGSRGNATLLRAGGAGLLVDLGLGPTALADRLASVGARWDGIAAVLLTHTHGDHVNDASLRWMARHGIRLYCHEGHRSALAGVRGFQALERSGGLRLYDDRPFLTPTGMRIEALPLSHDGPTFGFRIEGQGDRRARPVALGYLADTGCWSEGHADALADVDLLGVEFNHDVELQRRSGRSPALIARNLGDRGHLSNVQGAGLLAAVLHRSRPGTVRHVVLLHLSQDCNRPALALGEARAAVRQAGRRATVLTSGQWAACPDLLVRPSRRQQGSSATPTAPGFPWETD
jgi:phosphoribosyl 1,2-cyclic phosphodiesterase